MQSTESLHSSVQEVTAQLAKVLVAIADHSAVMTRIEVREQKARVAMLNAIKAYLETMNNGSEG